jgi:tetratricopeptide (TPR) repeat protein
MALVAEVALVIAVSGGTLLLSWTVHELSHAAASRLVGIPLFLVRIGPLAVDVTPAGWRLRYAGFKGRWAAVAPDLEQASPEGLRARAAFVLAAGAVGELLVAVGAGVVALRGGGLPFWIGAVMAGVSGLSNLLPVAGMDETGELRSDGRTLWELLVAPDRARAWLASATLASAALSGQRRPRDLDERWVALAISVEPSSAGLALGRMVAHHSALDLGFGERAIALLLSAPGMGELLPWTRRAQLAAWTAYSLARFHSDVEGAARALDVVDDWSENEWILDLATAALCLAAGRPDDALTLCDWLLLTPWRDGDAYAAMLRDQVEALRADAEAAVRSGASPEDRPAHTDAGIPTEKALAVAASLNQRAEELDQEGRREEAIVVYGEVVRRFGDDPLLRHCVFIAVYNRATTLRELGRHEETVEAYDEILRRFGDLAEPDDQAHLAAALAEKGSVLAELDRPSEALAVYDEVLRRFGDDEHPGTLSTVARTLLLKADALRRLGRPWEAVAATDDVLRRFGRSQDPALAQLVDYARREKQRGLSGTGRARRRPKRQRSR